MYQLTSEQEANILKAIKSVKDVPGLRVELIGAWVWVSGETKPNKELLKAAGFKWAHKKAMWYFAGVPSSGKGKDMLYIRGKYGAVVVSADSEL